MACSGCSRRASRLLSKMGFRFIVDPNSQEFPRWEFSNTYVTVTFHIPALYRHHTRATILAWITRFLFSRLKPSIIRRLTADEETRLNLPSSSGSRIAAAQGDGGICLPPCYMTDAGACLTPGGLPCN